jgi:phosphate-selective porin OprO/OprP
VHLVIKSGRALIALALIAIMIPASALAGEMTASWNNGLKLADDSGNEVKIGGRIYADWAWFSSDDDYDASARFSAVDGSEFRTARLFLEGKMHEVIKYKFQIDVSGSSVKFKDMYIAFKESRMTGVEVLVGQFKQPFGLEELTSSKYITFMERSQTAGYAPSRQSGVQLRRLFAGDKLNIAASAFRNSTSRGFSLGEEATGFAGRVAGTPWQTDEGNLLHVGVGAMTRQRGYFDDEFFATNPEAHLQPFFNAIAVPVDRATDFNFEAAAVFGPLSVQGEYMMMGVSAPEGAEDAGFISYYGQASFFLTGESRPYKASTAVFNRVKPKNNYGKESGIGAFEIAARYSSTDLNDGVYEGGTLDAITLGANWYLNPNTRVMFNWVRSDGESPAPGVDEQSATGVVQAFQTRFQIDF